MTIIEQSGSSRTHHAPVKHGEVGAGEAPAATATEAGATLAVGDDFAKGIAVATAGAATVGLVTLLAAALLAIVTYRARSRTTG